ncbi:hypothetical protein M405DRAFT_935433 [Rhizopogon salebrosus TDB-379]|nr:hypothetical protein M405DRAFT_935433 [Rhizopogon salebrosus TDB-379]
MVLTEQDFRVSRVMAFNACATLAVMLWDWVIGLPDETHLIWRRPRSSWVKWLFLFFRYGGLMAQVFNLLFVMRMETYKPINRATCERWISYQAVAVEAFLVAVDSLLILRVYAIWSRSRRVLGVLGTLVILEACSMAVSASIIVPDSAMNELCLFRKTPRAAAYFGIVALLTQSAILYLTLRKHFTTFARRYGPRNLSTLVVRDGGLAFIGIFAMFFGALYYSILGSERSDVLFFWIVCVLSICGCRIIINMDYYADRACLPNRTSDAIWITSDIIMDEDD